MSDDERAIRELLASWMTATKAGDTAKVLGLMTDDVVFLVAGQPPFGKETFAASLRGMKESRFEGDGEIEELFVTGSWAWCRARLSVTMTPPNGAAVRRAGYTLTIFRKEASGKWLLARDANLLTTQ